MSGLSADCFVQTLANSRARPTLMDGATPTVLHHCAEWIVILHSPSVTY